MAFGGGRFIQGLNVALENAETGCLVFYGRGCGYGGSLRSGRRWEGCLYANVAVEHLGWIAVAVGVGG